MTVTRNASWIEREYGTEKWPEVLAHIEGQIQSGEHSLARVVASVQRFKRGHSAGTRRAVVLHGAEHTMAWGLAWEGKYGWMAESILEVCEADTDLVLEMGSGWGVNLCNVWLRGGPRKARYVAAEYTEAGRNCTQRLGTLDKDFDVHTAPFDYYNPEFPAPPNGCRHAVVFSSQSIEQIGQLGDALIDAVCGLAQRVTVVHIEPVGFQLPEAHRPADWTGTSAAYAERNDYNRNLWALLKHHEARGRLEVVDVDAEVIGTNPHNSVSRIIWRKTNASS